MNTQANEKLSQTCLQKLIKVWLEFEQALCKVPVVQRIENGRLSLEDYQLLLLNIRQQVIEGSRWISRSASSFDRNYSDVRSEVISHAFEEHRDYQMLEKDYQSSGGVLEHIRVASRNDGSEALHGFLMYRASQSNPVDMLGAMWIIEGLGQKMATEWADLIEEQLGFDQKITSFMHYHGENDDNHMDKLYGLLETVCNTEQVVENILRTARVVSKLYILQLEEIDNG